MIEIKKLKKFMKENNVSDYKLRSKLGISSNVFNKIMKYEGVFMVTQVQTILEMFNCKYEDITHKSLFEFNEYPFHNNYPYED